MVGDSETGDGCIVGEKSHSTHLPRLAERCPADRRPFRAVSLPRSHVGGRGHQLVLSRLYKLELALIGSAIGSALERQKCNTTGNERHGDTAASVDPLMQEKFRGDH